MRLFNNDLISLELRSDPLENPATPLSSPALWSWMTGGEPTASGETINETNSLQIPTVYRCTRFISESLASLPLETWEHVGQGREKAVDHDLFYLLTLEPNPEMSAFTFKENLFGCMALTGNCYAQIERNSWGDPVAFWPLHPHKTKPVRVDNRLMYETADGMSGGAKRLLKPADVLHVPLFSFDGILGLSPIGLMRQSLGLAKATEKFGARFFGNGSRPGGVLLNKGPKPTPAARKELIDSWNQEQGGTNQGKTAFLFGGEWSYEQIGLSPEDSQFLATRNYQRADIASIFGLPPHYAGDTSRMSGNNAEQESLRVVTDTFRPYIARFENEIDRKLMPRLGVKAHRFFVSFDVSARLRGDFKTQQEGFAAGVQWGWYSPNDVRKKLGENPGPKELDVYRLPVNMTNAKLLLEDPTPAPGAPIDPADPQVLPPDPAGLAPTPAERKSLGMYATAFAGLYRRAFRQLCRRDKRDSRAIRSTIGPVLDAAAQLALESFHVPAEQLDELVAGLVGDVITSLEKRAAKWPAAIAEADVDELAGPEFLKAVRSIHINAAKNTSAAAAAAEVTE